MKTIHFPLSDLPDGRHFDHRMAHRQRYTHCVGNNGRHRHKRAQVMHRQSDRLSHGLMPLLSARLGNLYHQYIIQNRDRTLPGKSRHCRKGFTRPNLCLLRIAAPGDLCAQFLIHQAYPCIPVIFGIAGKNPVTDQRIGFVPIFAGSDLRVAYDRHLHALAVFFPVIQLRKNLVAQGDPLVFV